MKYSVGDELHIGNFNARILGYENKTYKYKCLECGYEGHKAGNLISKGIGCSCCSNRTVVKGINDITTTDSWMVKFFQGGEDEASLYTKSSGKKIIPKCPDCGRVLSPQKINNIYNHKGVSCACKDGISFPNKLIYFVMEQLLSTNKIKYFVREFHIKNDKNRFFDIYFETNSNEKYFVEMDGGIGHGEMIIKHNVKPTGGFNVYSSSIFKNDIIKEKIAESLKIKLIRIDCFYSDFEYIKQNIVESDLSKIVNLDCINWEEVEKQIYSNLMKSVCTYKQDNPMATVRDIADRFKLYNGTIRNYLTLGDKLGWCKFNKEIEKHRSKVNARHKSKYKVVLENINSEQKEEFDSVADFIRNNYKYFSIPFTKKTVNNRFNKGNNFIENYEGYNIYKINRRNCDGIRKSS